MMKTTITGHTRMLCLLGNPVAHSISPAMHNLSFQELGLDYVYLAFPTDASTIDHTLETLKSVNARGFNCTMPCKRLMADRCDELSDAAVLMNAVNTVVIEDGKFKGHNTDGIGYMKSVEDAGHRIIGKTMTLLGSGGASSAILAQAALDGVAKINVFARKGNSYHAIEQEIQLILKKTGCQVTLNELADEHALRASVSESAILVNASSVGMVPNTDACLIPDSSYFHPELIVSDVIYNPGETKLLTMAKEAGLSCFNGMYMLLYQGAAAFELWTGREMPVDLVRSRLFS
ncbi:MAG: shikimate dehydrogenase [Lachnospiraceae bacterium]